MFESIEADETLVSFLSHERAKIIAKQKRPMFLKATLILDKLKSVLSVKRELHTIINVKV